MIPPLTPPRTGLAHVVAILILSAHINRTLHQWHPAYQLRGGARRLHSAQLAVVVVLLLVPLFQLSGRLGASSQEHSLQPPAPFELAETGLAVLTWALLGWLLLLELGSWGAGGLVRRARWHTRFAVVLVTSSQLVKLRFLLASMSIEHRERQ
ncbi:hypothetical protein V8C86DRAFT_3151624 [Haematococcus lacustris]